MKKKGMPSPPTFVRTGPAQYVNRAGILSKAGDCIAPWGRRALISGGQKALAASEKSLIKSLDKAGIKWRKHLFTGECSPANIAKIKGKAHDLKADLIIGVGGGKSLDTAKQAATELGRPAVCIPTIAATCAATTALSVIYNDRGEFQGTCVHARNPALILVDPEIITRSPGMYLRAGILDSLAKWFEGRSVWPSVQNLDVPSAAAFQLADVLYKGHKKYAIDAVRLNAEHRVEDSLIKTLDLVILLTGMIQTLAKGTLFTAIAHPLHNGLTLIEESHQILHGLKVGYGIMVQLCVEKCPKKEFDEVLSFFRQLGLEPSLKGLNLPSDHELILRVAEKAANDPGFGPLNYSVNKFVIASAMEKLEKRLAKVQ
ncbi:MAG TPA: iron-containing alcohol dehydrogenase family protein [Terriglobia bacterium]|nr:iron-containing alcohol dehydrogenase family protein [Terriglobia bacterium]